MRMHQPQLEEASRTFFAILIAVDEYDSPEIRDLRGAVADARAVKTFLREVVGVPANCIQELHNSRATGENIKAAILGLSEDTRIQQGDSILIYYAGHGSEVSNPQPVPMPPKIQIIIPHDFNSRTAQSEAGQGIIDFIFSDWLAKVAKIKGDNITVILDSCHSGSGTRTSNEDSIRSISLPEDYILPTSIVTLLNKEAAGRIRGSRAAFSFAKSGLESHVLLAACREDQTTKELNGRGIFTVALLATLRRLGFGNVTNSGLINNLPELGREQNPQCEGVHNDRLFLGGMAVKRQTKTYEIDNNPSQTTEYIIRAGGATGIAIGAEFAVYAERPPVPAPPLGFLVVSEVQASLSTLIPKPGLPPFAMPRPGYALQTLSGPRAEFVFVAIQPGQFPDLKLITNLPQGMQIVDDQKDADLVLNKNHKGVGFEIFDNACAVHGLHSTARFRYETPDDVLSLLHAVTHFYFHLRRSTRGQNLDLTSRLKVECFEVLSPFHTSQNNLNCDGLVTVVAGGSDYDEGLVPAYGFRITNSLQIPLFIAVYFFNASDLSIKPYYEPPIPQFTARARPCLPAGGSLTIGYGSSGAIAREYYVEDGFDVDVGFLRIFASTEYVDCSTITQTSPFDDDNIRAVRIVDISRKPRWDSKSVTILQRKHVL